MKNTIITITTLLLLSCSTVKFIPPAPTQDHVNKAATEFPGVTLSQLDAGKKYFEANCDKCHKLKNPRKFSVAKLKSTVPEMAMKANKKAKKEVVTPDMEASILKYLVAMRVSK